MVSTFISSSRDLTSCLQVCYTTDKQMGYPCEISVVDTRTFNPDDAAFKVAIPTGGPKVSSLAEFRVIYAVIRPVRCPHFMLIELMT